MDAYILANIRLSWDPGGRGQPQTACKRSNSDQEVVKIGPQAAVKIGLLAQAVDLRTQLKAVAFTLRRWQLGSNSLVKAYGRGRQG